ncbi:MAG TPA: sigma-70 family RNA polymerase sigma factor [Longimicrobiales bacterium]|nr:sigma-70 family RNA polymerase sigma factor [Longimicrobiales bacterium]
MQPTEGSGGTDRSIPKAPARGLEPSLERELIRKCLSGDARFYEPLVRAYERPALRVALGILGNGDDAQDALQEAFVKAYQALGRFDLQRRFEPWFYQILRNQCRDVLRSRASRGIHEVADPHVQRRPAGPEASPESQRQRRAARDLLWSALERLDEGQREILVLKELKDLRYGEIAAILAIPEGTVASRLFNARRALKEVLEEMGATWP